MSNSSEQFYEQWSDKAVSQIQYDIESSVRKADVISGVLKNEAMTGFRKIIDFGCGYGKVAEMLSLRFELDHAYGFDFSRAAIEYANTHFATGKTSYHRLTTLDISKEIEEMKRTVNGRVDCIFLIDVLEHVPDCLQMMRELSQITDYFFIKLPIEENILFNYLLRKEYPSSKHSNGHVREFNVNTVHYFARKLGLTPVVEGTYVYDVRDSFPPFENKTDVKRYIKRQVIKALTIVSSLLLPKKIHLGFGGNGELLLSGYF